MEEENQYNDNFDQASEYLRQSIQWLSKYNIAPTPHNFQLAYEYVSGRYKSLTEEIDKQLDNKNELSAKQLIELYQRFFLHDQESIEAIRQELKSVIEKLQDEFGISTKKLSVYAKSLDQFMGRLEAPMNVAETKSETLKVINETSTMGKANSRLDAQLGKIIDEVNMLRTELEQIREEAMTDTLTQIANRKAFDIALEQTMLHAQQTGNSFCVVMADIDHFKKFNDNFGHLIGDKVLRFVASTFKSLIKGSDIAARYGGEEFVLILPKTQLNGALALANQLRKAIADGDLKDKATGERYGLITISLGVTQYRANDLPNTLVHRADKALYLAKNRGRNRVEYFS